MGYSLELLKVFSMGDTQLQQIFEHIQKYQKIAIMGPQNPSVDAVAAMSALASGLTVLKKTVTLVVEGGVPHRAEFLPFTDAMQPLQVDAAHLIISVDTSSAKLAELSYDSLPDKLQIFLSPKEGKFLPHDVTVHAGEFPFELIIVVGVQSPEQLGAVFAENTELFYSLPRINIDIHPENQNFGTINLVSVEVSALSELVYHILARFGEVELVPVAATAVLAGVLAATNNLSTLKTSTRLFPVVADVVAAGADHAGVVSKLFAPQTLSITQLLGRALARVKQTDDHGLVYSMLLPSDFAKTGETLEVSPNILTYVAHYFSGALSCVLAVSSGGETKVYVIQHPALDSTTLALHLGVGTWESGMLDTGVVYLYGVSTQTIENIESQFAEVVESAWKKA